MPLKHNLITLTDTAQLVTTNDNMVQEIHLHNHTKSSNEYIYIGGPDVTINNSIHLDPGESKVIRLRPGDELYALSDPSGLKLGVLQIQNRD